MDNNFSENNGMNDEKNLNETEKIETEAKSENVLTSQFVSTPRETVYIDNGDRSDRKKAKREKKERRKTSIGVASIALIIAACTVFSGGAAFAGTALANAISGIAFSGSAQNSAGGGNPSVIFQSFSDTNKTPGTYEQVAEVVTPTVVEIVTESVVTDSYMWGGSYVKSGAGSGVIISSDGMIITNAHVISGANTITVTLKDGSKYTATVIGSDPDGDIAVIKIEASNLPCAVVGNSDSLKVGQEVVAVGNPLGNLGGTVTNGIVSALSRKVTIDGTEMTLLQTNAAVNPGNSGGGLFNLYGELIGIVNAKSTSSSSGTAVEGIGFAIPINSATKIASELANYGYVRGKVYIGISYVDVNNSWTAMQYRVNSLGVYIISSEFTDELKPADRITAIDGKVVEYSDDIKSALKDYKVGDEIVITVVRDGKYIDVKVTLHEYVPSSAKSSENTATKS